MVENNKLEETKEQVDGVIDEAKAAVEQDVEQVENIENAVTEPADTLMSTTHENLESFSNDFQEEMETVAVESEKLPDDFAPASVEEVKPFETIPAYTPHPQADPTVISATNTNSGEQKSSNKVLWIVLGVAVASIVVMCLCGMIAIFISAAS